MKIVTGNIWTYEANWYCIPTNTTVNRKDGVYTAVMGAGVAKQARIRYRDLQSVVGSFLIKETSPRVILLPKGMTGYSDNLVIFPTKTEWHERSSLGLIQKSSRELAANAEIFPQDIFVLPRPGCGNGGLDWLVVKFSIENLLPDNVHVIDLPRGERRTEVA